ncbi:MAG: HupE/UreJ family protein [Gammaproteobacteria bacterium]
MQRTILFVLLMLVIAPAAQAHEVAKGGGFMLGLLHPVLGFDHLLAMVSVGILSTQFGGRAIWQVPATFVVIMVVGGVLGIQGVGVPSVETGIAVSVMVLGAALAIGRKIHLGVCLLFVGLFALFHGHAHGVEMPHVADPKLYAAGFVTGTAAIHILGVAIGLVAERIPQGVAGLRYVGAGIAGIGVHLLIGA